jgi:hypothetical protein
MAIIHMAIGFISARQAVESDLQLTRLAFGFPSGRLGEQSNLMIAGYAELGQPFYR